MSARDLLVRERQIWQRIEARLRCLAVDLDRLQHRGTVLQELRNARMSDLVAVADNGARVTLESVTAAAAAMLFEAQQELAAAESREQLLKRSMATLTNADAIYPVRAKRRKGQQ